MFPIRTILLCLVAACVCFGQVTSYPQNNPSSITLGGDVTGAGNANVVGKINGSPFSALVCPGGGVGCTLRDFVSVKDAAYGALGTARSATDGAITSGQTALTSTNITFTAADVGLTVEILGAGTVSGTIASGTYTSGATVTGATGKTCMLASGWNNSVTSAYAMVALTGTNALAGGTALTIINGGTTASAAPTQATLSNGTATCSGTVTLATVLASNPLVTTIASYTNATTIQTTLAASTTVSGARIFVGPDDTTNIQAAETAAAASNRSVYIPCGTYLTSAAITDAGNVSFYGENQNCSIIHLTAGASTDAVDVTGSNVAFRHLTIDANGNSGNAGTAHGVKLTSSTTIPLSRIIFDDVSVINAGGWCVTWGNAVQSAVSNLLVTNSTFTGCGGPQFGGITIGSTLVASNMTFTGNTFGSTAFPPARITSQAHVGLYISDNVTSQIWSNINISNNSFGVPILGSGGTQQETDGIVVSSAGVSGAGIKNVTISGNAINSTEGNVPTDGHMIELWGISQAQVSNNAIGDQNNSILFQAGAAGVPCNGTVANNTINAPSVTNTTQIQVSTGCPVNVVGNRVDAGAIGIGISSGGSTVVANTVKIESNTGEPIQLKCQDNPSCIGLTVTGNITNGVAGGRGIYFDVGGHPFVDAVVTSNSIDTAAWGIEFVDTTSTGVLANNVFLNITSDNYYQIPSTFTLATSAQQCTKYTLSNNGTNWTVAATPFGTHPIVVAGIAIPAATTSAPVLFALPAKGQITSIQMKTTTAWSGTGFTTMTLSIGDSAGSATSYTSTTYDMFAAVSNTNYQVAMPGFAASGHNIPLLNSSITYAGSNVLAEITGNQNLNANTITGVTDIEACWVTLP